MEILWKIIYNIFTPLLFLVFKFIGIFNSKIRYTLKVRKNLFKVLEDKLLKIDASKPTIWFHSSSMGEFEQTKPLLEKYYSSNEYNIVVTFFSPSGYENQKNYQFAHVISYLPLDFYCLSKKFVEKIKPSKVFFTRYDLWPNLLWILQKKNVKTYFIDATLKDSSLRLLPIIKSFHISIFKVFDMIFTISENDKKNILKFEVDTNKIIVAGDTRYDRVYNKSLDAKNTKLLDDKVINNKKIIIFGSSWLADQNHYLEGLKKLLNEEENLLAIIVPHEPTKEHIKEITEKLDHKYILYSNISEYIDERIIIIDKIGLLLTLYQYANIAFVGGSFEQGIHNVLEPAVYKIPVIYGPKIENSQEAKLLIKEGVGFIFNNNEEFYFLVKDLLDDNDKREQILEKLKEIFSANIGAAERIFNYLLKLN